MTKKLRILLVEDCQDDELLLSHEVRRGGYEPVITRVFTLQDTRAALEQDIWDVVISDYDLPGFNGLDALAVLRESGRDLPFILVSGVAGEETAVVAMKSGAHDYLVKGSLSRLVPAIEREIREAAIRRDSRRAAAALRDGERTLATIFDHAPVVMLVVDDELRLRRLNQAGCRLSGRTSDETLQQVVGSGLGCLHAMESPRGCGFSPACRQCGIRRAIRATLQTHRSQHAVESPMPVAQGDSRSQLHFLVSTAPIELAERLHVLVCLEDVSERLQAADALACYAAALEQTNRLLDTSRRELEQFVDSSSHDLRAPVVSIHGFASLLKLRAAALLDEPSGRYVDRILANAEMMESLLRDLLHASRISPPDAAAQRIDMNRLIGDILQALAPAALEKGVRLSRQSNLPPVQGQPSRLREALTHLVANAIGFMPARSGAHVEVGYDPEATASAQRCGAFYVRDNGAGIDARHHSRVFRLFHRGPHPHRDRGGTGVGLAIVKRIVNAHGGDVWLRSTPGEGATFYFFLPSAAPPLSTAIGGAIDEVETSDHGHDAVASSSGSLNPARP